LGTCHAFIDAITGAPAPDAVKFQTHNAAAESTPSEPLAREVQPAGRNTLRLLKRAGVFSSGRLKTTCRFERGLLFLVRRFLLAVGTVANIGIGGLESRLR